MIVASPAVDVPKRPLKLVLPPDPPLDYPTFVRDGRITSSRALKECSTATVSPAYRSRLVSEDTVGGGRRATKIRAAASAIDPATNRAAVVDESAIGCGRAAGEHCGATPERLTGSRRAVIGKSATACARDVIEINKAGVRLEVCATVRRKEGAAPCCRTVIE